MQRRALGREQGIELLHMALLVGTVLGIIHSVDCLLTLAKVATGAAPTDTGTTDAGSSSSSTPRSGFTEDQKIALGVGIGVGLPSAIMAVWGFVQCVKKILPS
jgi:hypothetical protein